MDACTGFRDQKVAGSNPVTSTKAQLAGDSSSWAFTCYSAQNKADFKGILALNDTFFVVSDQIYKIRHYAHNARIDEFGIYDGVIRGSNRGSA